MLPAQRLSNRSDAHNTMWSTFDFDTCQDLEGGRYIWAFCAMVCFVLGFPASVAIFLEMFKTWKRGTPIKPNDFFMLNLSIMDVGFLGFIPLGVLNTYVLKRWVIEALWTGFYALNQSGRPLLMTCVCLDCYFAVVHPIIYHKHRGLTPRIVMAGIVWIVTFATGMLFSLFLELYHTILPYVPFIISIVIIGICDFFNFYKLIYSCPGSVTIHPQKQRSIQILTNSLVMTIISYLPPVILYVVGKYKVTDVTVFTCVIAIPITITSSLGSAVMSILYLNNIGKLDHLRFACCRRSN